MLIPFIAVGFTDEADAYMSFISDRFRNSLTKEGALPIMFTIRGSTDIPELELDHLDGYKGSRPVRIGNGAAFHQQFDIYGELMDGIYLYSTRPEPFILSFNSVQASCFCILQKRSRVIVVKSIANS
jgi:GH15 family glucan-1,4-alpha-glucosidase